MLNRTFDYTHFCVPSHQPELQVDMRTSTTTTTFVKAANKLEKMVYISLALPLPFARQFSRPRVTRT